jgi:putative glutamine amidotransferase
LTNPKTYGKRNEDIFPIERSFLMKPIILITCKNRDDDFGVGGLCYTPANYCNAIIRAGGIPLISALADAREYAQIADGILFTGSNCDVTPELYGQENRASNFCMASLDEMELALFEAFRSAGKPIFGICRGLQLINVALGGTLIQDIPQEVPDLTVHSAVYRKETIYHPVTAVEGSLLGRLFGRNFQTNSYHHQAVLTCGAGLRATVSTEEGVIEAIEHESEPILGVQWHPERMMGQEQQDLPNMFPLFRHFIALCSK